MKRILGIIGAMLLVFSSQALADANLTLASEFLKGRQLSGGSFDSFSSPNSAAAVFALHRLEGNSSNVSAGLQYLKADLENPASYSWSEADIPGLNLYVYSKLAGADSLNLSDVALRLVSMQGSGGGFIGYSQCVENCTDDDWANDLWLPSEDAISTSMAILGLDAAHSLNDSVRNGSVNFLLRMRNADGSFNLTNDTVLGNFWALGPDIYSQTGFALLALHEARFGGIEINGSLEFLRGAAAAKFGNNTNATFSPVVTAYVLAAFNDTNSSLLALSNLPCLQNPDGGFRDPLRYGESSNVLDTALAMLALGRHYNGSAVCESDIPAPSPSPSASPSPSISPAPTGTPTPVPQQSGSSYSSNNYFPPAPTPTKKPTPTASPTPSPSPKVKQIAIEEEKPISPSPTISLVPTTTNKNSPADRVGNAPPSPMPAGPNATTGFFAGALANWAYGIIVIVILGAAYIFVRRK